MIAREDPQAFFGLAPESLQPRAPPRSRTMFGGSVSNDHEPNPVPKVDLDGDHRSLYDADSSDDEAMQIDSSISRPSRQSSVSGPENQAGEVLTNTLSRQLTPSRIQMRQEQLRLRVSIIPNPLWQDHH